MSARAGAFAAPGAARREKAAPSPRPGDREVSFVMVDPLTALGVAALLGALLYLLVFPPLRDAPPLAQAVASLGVLQVLQSVLAIRQGTAPVVVGPIFPTDRWELGSAFVLADRVYLAATVVALALVLAALFRFTRFGLLTRAAAESSTGAFVSGVSPDRLALVNWVVSALVAGLAGILIAPVSPLTPITYTMFVVPAVAAAVVGRFQNLVAIVVAGLAIGMLQSEALSLAGDHSWMPKTGSAELVPLLVIMGALVALRGGLPVRGGLVRQRLGDAPRPRSYLLPVVAGTAVGVVALAATTGTWRAAVIGSLIAATIGMSLVVVTGFAGQVSLAQLALAGTAAFTLSALTEHLGIPFPLAPLLAALVATAIGVVVGLPALRLRGLTLGMVTLAFAFAIEAAWFRNTDVVGTGGARVTQPELLGVDLAIGSGKEFPRIEFGLLCLATLVVVGCGVAALRRSTLGSAMLAVRANERSAAAVGVNVTAVKVASFAIGSFIAGLGGSLLAYRRGVVTFDSFTALGGLAVLGTAYLAGVTSVSGGLLAGLLAASGVAFLAMDRWVAVGDWFQVVTGLLLVVTLITHPEGLASGGHRLAALADRRRRLRGPAPGPRPTATPVAPTIAGPDHRRPSPVPVLVPRPIGARTAARQAALRVEHLTVRYGGVVAVDDVTLTVPGGSVVGLIGPNGAGKTSLIDAVAGFAPATGAVRLAGRRVDRLAPHARIRAGMGRTFQSLELYDDLSVEENVSVAAVGSRWVDRGEAAARTLEQLGAGGLRDRPAGELSQGERQLVSIARAQVAEPSVLLLDEPAAGLDTTESRWLGERIREIGASGAGVLLVDHDVALVLDVCDHVVVLDFGRVIAEGTADEIRANRAVADAYLGRVHDATATATAPGPVTEVRS